MNKNTDLILFDWDRTISDVEGPTNELLKKTFIAHNNEGGYEDFIKCFRAPENQGRKVRDRLEDILGEQLGGKYHKTFMDMKNKGVLKPKIFTGLMEQIQEIKNSQERTLGIVTNKNVTEVYNESFGQVKEYFDFIVGGDNIASSDLKPSGHLLNLSLQRTSKKVRTILMIGDTSNDINALGNSNFTCEKTGILSFWGISSEERVLQRERVDTSRITSLQEIHEVSSLAKIVNQILQHNPTSLLV